MRIPFNKAFMTGNELRYVEDVLRHSKTSGDGVYTDKCQRLMEQRFGAAKVLLTTSCSTALELAVLLADLSPGDEVILPSFTFVSTANALVLRGVVPRFVDIRPDTKNLDENFIAAAITPRTRAIMPVHYAGVGCDMRAIMDIAQAHSLMVIEDAAQGVNARFESDYLGTIAPLGAYSFHETKNYSAGECGAIVINDPALIERAEILREKGTNRSQFNRGQVDKYTWVDIGSSFLPSDLLAAVLYAQLEAMDAISAHRERIYEHYMRRMQPLAEDGRVSLPVIPDECQSNYHMFYLTTTVIEERTALISHLRQRDILAVFHYVPLHNAPMAQQLGLPQHELPVTQAVSERLVRLPMYCELTTADIDSVCDAVVEF